MSSIEDGYCTEHARRKEQGEGLLGPATCSPARIAELEAQVRMLLPYKARLDWLHTGGGKNDTDLQGYEWGVARVKFDDHGQVEAVLWTNSDHSDLDAEMQRVKPENATR